MHRTNTSHGCALSQSPDHDHPVLNPTAGVARTDAADTDAADLDGRAARTLAALGRVVVPCGPLMDILQTSGEDREGLVAAIEASPALAARLLSVSNAAGVGLREHLSSVKRAVVHLGAARARTVALTFGLRMLAEGAGLPPDVMQKLWHASLRKAAAARLAANIIDPAHADQAYALGLLQDLGLPMLMAVDPDFYKQHICSGRGSWSEREVRRFGLDHAAVGCRLLQQWNGPARICDAVLDHHRPPMDHQAREAIQKLPSFIASPMPHLGETPTPVEHEWMIAVHAQFLSHDYATPEAFCQAADQAAVLQGGGDDQPTTLAAADFCKMVQVVAADSEAMVCQLSELERAMGKQRQHLNHLRFQAFTDPLTKVLNRRGFSRLGQRRCQAAVHRPLTLCMISIDLDDFKPINDRFGHEAGDLVLRALAKLLRRNLDRSDLIGRMGGDEFAVLLTAVSEQKAGQIARRLAEACIGTTVRVGPGRTVRINLSLGAAFCEAPAENLAVEDLLALADQALYQRKRGGKNGVVFTRCEPTSLRREIA